MRLPKQSPPIQRPHFVKPHKCVDVTQGNPESLVNICIDLMHGANYNDPQTFEYPSYEYLMMSAISPEWETEF